MIKFSFGVSIFCITQNSIAQNRSTSCVALSASTVCEDSKTKSTATLNETAQRIEQIKSTSANKNNFKTLFFNYLKAKGFDPIDQNPDKSLDCSARSAEAFIPPFTKYYQYLSETSRSIQNNKIELSPEILGTLKTQIDSAEKIVMGLSSYDSLILVNTIANNCKSGKAKLCTSDVPQLNNNFNNVLVKQYGGERLSAKLTYEVVKLLGEANLAVSSPVKSISDVKKIRDVTLLVGAINQTRQLAVSQINRQFCDNLLRTPESVTALESEFSLNRTKTQFTNALELSKTTAISIVNKNFSGSPIQEILRQRIETVNFCAFEPSDREQYSKNEFGFESLKSDAKAKVGTDLSILFMGQSSMEKLNAHYLKSQNSVCLFPAMIKLYSSYPEGFLLTMGHEIGHSIDPLRTPEGNTKYSKVISCLKDAGIRDDQMGEAFSDLVGAEVLAAYLAQIPTAAQKMASFERALAAKCILLSASAGREDVHPLSTVRIDTLLTSSQNLMAAIGCETELKDKKYCDLGFDKNRSNLTPAEKHGAIQ